jgi:hypothetical protein
MDLDFKPCCCVSDAQGDFDRALMDAKEGKQDANRKLEMLTVH